MKFSLDANHFKKILIHATVFGIIFCFARLYLQKIWTNEKIPNKKNMFLLRIIVFLILVSLLIILAYPLLIIYDISRGGNGFGICNDLVNCVIPITEGPRLLIILIASFFVLVFLLRIIMKFINSLNKEKSIL